MPTTFLRLLAADDKAAALRAATTATRAGTPATDAYTVDPASFRQVPGAPFAYWVSDSVREVFASFPSFEGRDRTAKQGLATADDFRFVRAWWEIDHKLVTSGTSGTSPSEFRGQTFIGKRWVPFAKGGAYSTYYADIHLLVMWAQDGKEIRGFIDPVTMRQLSRPQNAEYYFQSGLTWSDRTTRFFSARIWPRGGVFSIKGSAGFFPHMEDFVLGLMNARVFNGFLSLIVGAGDRAARSYQVGTIGQVPFPQTLPNEEISAVRQLALEAHDRKRDADRDDEVTHPFTVPALVRLGAGRTLREAVETLRLEGEARRGRLAAIQRIIDDRCFALYGFSAEDRAQVEGIGAGSGTATLTAPVAGDEIVGDAQDAATDEDSDEADTSGDTSTGEHAAHALVADLLMYALGCAYGRWDVRIGQDAALAPRLAEPFAPLPVCAPAALVGPDGLPAIAERIASDAWLRARPNAITLPDAASIEGPATIAATEYPVTIAWDGILVDDAAAENDLVHRVRAVLAQLWGARADAIEAEACGILGVRDLREYFRNPRLFFDRHISRYSKSRRKAPIYWLLQSPKRTYSIWLYYHRLDADLVFKALNFHLLPKIRLEEQTLDELKLAKQQAGASGPEARRIAQALERQEALLADLREFHARLDRAARHHLTPDLNDGVVLNIAPFWDVVPWKEAKAAWGQLTAGAYAWSSIGKQLREKGVVGSRP